MSRINAKRRFVGDFEIKEKDDSRRTFSGYLAASPLDLGRDIVHPGAFKRTLSNFRASNGAAYVPLIDTHSYDSVFNAYGHMLDGEEHLTGNVHRYELEDGAPFEVPEMKLVTEWQVIDGIDGERLLDRLRPGSVRKMSMGYEVFRDDFVGLKTYGRVRNLREVGLAEGSLVLFPMQPAADVITASVKSFDAIAAALRDGTLTDTEKAELRAMLDAPPADAGDDQPPTDAPKTLAPEAQAELRNRLLRLKLARLVTRAA